MMGYSWQPKSSVDLVRRRWPRMEFSENTRRHRANGVREIGFVGLLWEKIVWE
jgi:hypothetical protein